MGIDRALSQSDFQVFGRRGSHRIELVVRSLTLELAQFHTRSVRQPLPPFLGIRFHYTTSFENRIVRICRARCGEYFNSRTALISPVVVR